ncbi:Nitroreductase [Frankia canadensis]|uniref:Nitroreductase n=1 Tax=Frankia canadensis TaxID=1836972 RepID=A0A2I2KV80_9ACTN|nr:nitroreductase family protein [Frankia canadensis]SNQ49568.1 Nitroreductase [Frankia canadensis]SOU56858.1 Nitroreductase [Frankia canadensis]
MQEPHPTPAPHATPAPATPTTGPAASDLLDLLATTRAIRRLRPDPVTDDELATVLFAATRAPSGSNRQPGRFLVLRDGPRARRAKQLIGEGAQAGWAQKRTTDRYDEGSGTLADSPKARMARTMERFVDTFDQTPVVVLACLARYREPRPTDGASIYPACQNLLLAARAIGLGGVMSMWHVPVEAQLRALLDIPDEVAISATITLGRPEGRHGPVRRRPLHEVVHEEGWGLPAAWAVDPPGTAYTAAGPPTGHTSHPTGQNNPPAGQSDSPKGQVGAPAG